MRTQGGSRHSRLIDSSDSGTTIMIASVINERYRSVDLKLNVHVVGDSGCGKTAFLKSVSQDAPLASGDDGATSGLLHASTAVQVSLNPKAPQNESARPVTVAWSEFGAATAFRDFFQLAKGGTRSLGKADALGLFFSAHSEASLERLVAYWLRAFPLATARSQLTPFVFVVQTHCDGLSEERRLRDRRIVDIAMRKIYGAAYMYFQVNARDTDQCMAVVEQIAVQARHQPRRESGSIHILGDPDDTRCGGLIRQQSALGELLHDLSESERLYRWRRRIAQWGRWVAARLMCRPHQMWEAEDAWHDLDVDDFVDIF